MRDTALGMQQMTTNFVEISSCEHKIRLHKVGTDNDKHWIAKMKKLRDAIDRYIQFLETETK